MAGSSKSKGAPGRARKWLVRGLKIGLAAAVAGLLAGWRYVSRATLAGVRLGAAIAAAIGPAAA